MINSIQIADYTVNIPVLLAPMVGITDLPFRSQVADFGANYMVCEMQECGHLASNVEEALRRSDFAPYPNQLSVVQLVGNDPDLMARTAQYHQGDGVDIIDINFGCPAKKVVTGYGGSALMQTPNLAQKIIEKVITSVNIPVTIKMRLGWDWDHLNGHEFAQMAESCGVSLITVHGRTRCQKFKGHADWQKIRLVKEAVSIPVIANGDIVGENEAKQCLIDSGADGVMIGRGSCGRPWFIQQLSHFLTDRPYDLPSTEKRFQTILKHLDSMVDYYGKACEYFAIKLFRKHWVWYFKALVEDGLLPRDSRWRQSLGQMNTREDFHRQLDKWINNTI